MLKTKKKTINSTTRAVTPAKNVRTVKTGQKIERNVYIKSANIDEAADESNWTIEQMDAID